MRANHDGDGFAVDAVTLDAPMDGVVSGEKTGEGDANSALEREAQELGISVGQLKAIIVRVGTDRHRVAAAAGRISECATRGAFATAISL